MSFNIEVEVGKTVRLTTAGKYCDRDIMVTAKGTESAEYAEYTWNQIPTAAKNFLDDVTYDPSDYSTSMIDNYVPVTTDINNTYPIGITIETESGILDRNGYEMSVSSGNTTLYNDVPNQYTEYVNRNNGVVSKAGTLKPTGALRQIRCATFNVRDLGGWACDGDSVVGKNLIDFLSVYKTNNNATASLNGDVLSVTVISSAASGVFIGLKNLFNMLEGKTVTLSFEIKSDIAQALYTSGAGNSKHYFTTSTEWQKKTYTDVVAVTKYCDLHFYAQGSSTAAGTFYLRNIQLELGSTATEYEPYEAPHGTVKYGLLYRGGEFQAADADIFINQLGIRHELNLRGTAEAESEPTTLRNYVEYTCPEKYVWYTIGDAYKETWKEILRCVFDSVTKNEPVYFHCSAGADRTGTVACILEAILGMSQSDIDKDYELTCFASGVSTDNTARRRNESEWSGLITQINNLSGSTFRDKVINWVASLGFTADEINAYRAAMIDGTPDTITLDIDTYSVTNTLTNAETDNDVTTAVQYQPYNAEITVPTGYVIDGIKITMGGVDVTASAFKGAKTNLHRAVTSNLTNCTIDGKKAVIDGQGFVATLTAAAGYTLEGGSAVVIMESAPETVPVTLIEGYRCNYNVGSPINIEEGSGYVISEEIPVKCGITYTTDYYSNTGDFAFRFVGYNDSGVVTEAVEIKPGSVGTYTVEWTPTVATTTKMRLRGYISGLPNADLTITKGGVDVSAYYSNGKIAIPNVTGDIVITAVAVKSAATYTNLAVTNSTNTTDWSIWCNNARIGSDGLYRENEGTCVTNYILVNPGETIYIANFALSENMATYADTNSESAGNAYTIGSHPSFTGYSATANGAQITLSSDSSRGFVRFTGTPTGNLEDVIITINEPLE